MLTSYGDKTPEITDEIMNQVKPREMSRQNLQERAEKTGINNTGKHDFCFISLKS